MPLFGHKDKDHHHKEKDVIASDRLSNHDDSTTTPAGKEFKYERVEKIDVDSAGNAQLRDVREDRGSEDPGMNFKDKRPPALVPGAPMGYVPDVADIDMANRYGVNETTFVGDNASINSSHHSQRGSGKVVTREEQLKESRYVGADTASIASSIRDNDSIRESEFSTPGSVKNEQYVEVQQRNSPDSVSLASSHHSMRSGQVRAGIVQDQAPRLEREVDNIGDNINRLADNLQSNQKQSEYLREEYRQERVPYNSEYVQQGYRQGYDIPVNQGLNREVRQETELVRTEQQRHAVVDVVSVPIQRMETGRMEHLRTGVTYTTDKELTIPGPLYAPPIANVTHDLLAQGSGGVSAEIHAATNVDLVSNANIHDMGPEEYERYRQKVEELAREHEMTTAAKAAAYRNQVEKDAELIRKTLERQHIRDIEFRTDMIETAVDRQQHEIQLEAEYAMRALEAERDSARQALDQARMQTNIDVSIDSAIGKTVSKGSVNTSTERELRENVAPFNTTATRI